MTNSDTLCGWGEKERVTYFLDNADIIVPKRHEQLTFLLDLFGWHQEEPIVVLDLGAGFGALTEQILTRYPRSMARIAPCRNRAGSCSHSCPGPVCSTSDRKCCATSWREST